MAELPATYSYYQSNIDPSIVAAQARVFAHLGIPLVQQLDDSIDHGGWLTRLMRNDVLGEIAVVADIDAFPLTYDGYLRLIESANAGSIAGLAQVANHKNPNHVYAGPMFLAAKREIYTHLGAPDMSATPSTDVAQSLTILAESAGLPISFLWPRFALHPQWSMAEYGVFGIGTFYGNDEFFHLFQSRYRKSIDLFVAVANGVICGKHDFQLYLEILELTPPKRKKLLGIF